MPSNYWYRKGDDNYFELRFHINNYTTFEPSVNELELFFVKGVELTSIYSLISCQTKIKQNFD